MRKVDNNELEHLNNCFSETGISYSMEDSIYIGDSAIEVASFLFNHNLSELLELLNTRKPDDEGSTLLDNLIDDLDNVFYSEGNYYVLKQTV